MGKRGWVVVAGVWLFLACGRTEEPLQGPPAPEAPPAVLPAPPVAPAPEPVVPEPASEPPPVPYTCLRSTCGGVATQCGLLTDNCGGTLDCGACADGLVCSAGRCVPEEQACEPHRPAVELGSALPLTFRGGHLTQSSTEWPSCGQNALDTTYAWTAPEAGTFVIDTAGSRYYVVLAVQSSTCPYAELSCDENKQGSGYTSRAVVTLAQGERVRLVVDGGFMARNEHTLHIQRLAAEECSNGRDDDGDGALDCVDTDCEGAAACELSGCAAADLPSQLPLEFSGITAAQGGRFPVSCGEQLAESRAYRFTPPRTGQYQLRLHTNVVDHEVMGELSVLAGCAGPELACVATPGARKEMQVWLNAGTPVLVVVRTIRHEDGGGGFQLLIDGPDA